MERSVGRRPEVVLVFGDLFGNLDGVAANRPERRRKLFAAVVVMLASSHIWGDRQLYSGARTVVKFGGSY